MAGRSRRYARGPQDRVDLPLSAEPPIEGRLVNVIGESKPKRTKRDDGPSAHPTHVEFGILKPTGELWVELHANRG